MRLYGLEDLLERTVDNTMYMHNTHTCRSTCWRDRKQIVNGDGGCCSEQPSALADCSRLSIILLKQMAAAPLCTPTDPLIQHTQTHTEETGSKQLVVIWLLGENFLFYNSWLRCTKSMFNHNKFIYCFNVNVLIFN